MTRFAIAKFHYKKMDPASLPDIGNRANRRIVQTRNGALLSKRSRHSVRFAKWAGRTLIATVRFSLVSRLFEYVPDVLYANVQRNFIGA